VAPGDDALGGGASVIAHGRTCGAAGVIRRRVNARVRAIALIACAFAVVAPAAAKTRAAPGHGRVLVLRLEGPVSPVMGEALDQAVRRADESDYDALVLEIDTPGGLESTMRTMVQKMLASPRPILAWVTPGGARAASAGVFIVMASDVAAMAPGTNIGAATPISMQGPMDSTLARKATNDAAAFAHTIAVQRGRNAEWAERAVREAVAVDEREAVRLHVVDFEASTLPELLARAAGREWRRGETRTVLGDLSRKPVDTIEPDFRQRLLALIADPNIAYILLMLGFYGILFELQNPGAILPGVIGGISLILAFLALSTLPFNSAGIALIVLAVVFFVAEVKVASHGLLAAGGIISMLLGSMILFRGGVALSWGVIFGVTLTTALFFILVIGVGLRARRRKVVTGAEGLIGARAWAMERLAPAGQVRLRGELWQAVSDNEIEAGDEVEVTGAERLTLRVRPASRREAS
jgi:membrane-bound serine protease (ClpP class)